MAALIEIRLTLRVCCQLGVRLKKFSLLYACNTPTISICIHQRSGRCKYKHKQETKKETSSYNRPKFHLARLNATRHVRLCRASRDERVERDECVDCQAVLFQYDDEEAVELACTRLVFCALSVHVNKTERRHAVWVKDYLKKERLLDATIPF